MKCSWKKIECGYRYKERKEDLKIYMINLKEGKYHQNWLNNKKTN